MNIFTKPLAALGVAALLSFNANAQNGVHLSYSTDDYVQLPNNLLNTVTGDFTIEFWVKWDGPSNTSWQRVFDFAADDDKYMFFTPSGYDANTNTSRAIFAITSTGISNEQRLMSPVELPVGTWTHVAITLNDATNTGTLYVNGTAVATNTSMTLDVSDILPLANNWLGRSNFSGPPFNDPYFNGAIDEFRISNVVRYTSNFTPTTAQFSPDANTVALYHFNEGTGQTTADASGNGYTGILGGTLATEPSDPTWTTGSILPITVSQFSAKKINGNIELKWTANVTGNGGQMIIERSSDGNTFRPIGAIPVAANAGTSNFSFADRQFNNGRNYYRLRIVEAGIADKYSSVVLVDATNGLYAAYPTAVTAQLYIKIPKPTNVAIYNNSGLLIRKVELQSSQNINVSDLSKGVYHLQFEGSEETVRFVKM